MTLIDTLVAQGADRAAVETAFAAPGVSSREAFRQLSASATIESSDWVRALARHFNCDWLETIPEQTLDPALVQNLPVDYARKRAMLPIRLGEGGIGLVVADPAEHFDLGDARLLLGETPTLLVAAEDAILRAIETVYFQRAALPSATNAMRATAEASANGTAQGEPDDRDLLRSGANADAPARRLVNQLLLDALQANASDIHIEPFPRRVQVRVRVDGILRPRDDVPKDLQAPLVSRLKIMGRLDIAEKRLPQDGMARVSIGEREIDIRVSTIPVAEGERVVLRLLRHDTALLGLEHLGMPADCLATFRRLIREPHGVIWVTGPTGSGKTTTLYSALNEIDTQRQNILTIEDPIEYQLPDIGQIGVKPKIGLTFAAGLRSVLRQDPDIVLVGETRDLETADIVIQASLTGHLVFSTLHTNTALGAILRLTDLGVQPYLVAESCKASMAQRLVRRLAPARSREHTVTDADIARWGSWSRPLLGETIQVADDDKANERDSYTGRIGIFELVPFTPEIRAAIRTQASADELESLARAAGAPSLVEDGLTKIRAGLTDPAEVARVLSAV